ncbi:MAG TPA: PIG-L deacetylase family protein [Chitinophagaceae bacterium]|nr:PIG-L deacetylase family protein [Chitinophagaceae bacterium]
MATGDAIKNNSLYKKRSNKIFFTEDNLQQMKPKYFLCIAVCFLLICINCFAQKTIVVITPHPDDAEASCGGLIANSIAAGDKVIILTMTGGELGIGGKSREEARAIRTAEAYNAASVLKANVEFFGAIDASLAFDSASSSKLTEILLKWNPAIVLAPWPLDVHSDHQATGLLAWKVFQDKRFSFSLFFYETINEPHTKTFGFIPTEYIDISAVMEIKKKALYQHQSQHPSQWYGMYETLSKVRGYEADKPFAEAYCRAQNSSGMGGRSNSIKKTLSVEK